MKLQDYLFIIFIIYSCGLFGQPMSEADLDNMLEIAEERVLNHDYYNGLVWYEKCYDLNKNWAIAQNIGHMNMHLRDYAGAVEAYNQAISWDESNENPELRFLLAKALKMNGQTEEALKTFEFFQSMNAEPSFTQLAALEIQGIRLLKELPDDNTVIVSPLAQNINSRFSETAPFFIDDESIVFSAFDAEMIDNYKNYKSEFTSKIFTIDLLDDNRAPRELTDIKNKSGWHQANLAYSPDRNIRIVTYAHLNGLKIDRTKIYLQEHTSSGWSEPLEIEALGEEILARHVNIGIWENQLTFFFTAELHSGEGASDIYYAYYKGQGEISNPVSLFGPVNTAGNDISPFFYKNALYFSSDGHPSMGGLDIFVTHWDGLVWSAPYNLGPSINSSADDFYFVSNSDQSKSLFVSNRPQGNSFRSKTCCDDIYEVTYLSPTPNVDPVIVDKPEIIPVDNSGVELNQPILLSNIYFDFNSDYVNMASQSDLDILYDLMIENPNWIVEVSTHTDSRGLDLNNLNLSQRRADNVREYLVERGINPSRLVAKGYGEEYILNQCKNNVPCSEKEHAYNRRAEFTVLNKDAVKLDHKNPEIVKYPKMKFDKSFIDFGSLKKGDKKTKIFNFVNTGDADLIIELASACECTTLDYPTDPIKPGEGGQIVATYDSKDKIGEQEVTIDILANTDPIIVEARFRVFVVE